MCKFSYTFLSHKRHCFELSPTYAKHVYLCRHAVVVKCVSFMAMATFTGSACELGTYVPLPKLLDSVNKGDHVLALKRICTRGDVPPPRTFPVYTQILYGVSV